ncbi:MAG TPA: PD-(D/E)XK nuclease family protein [Candidatus Levybacteria bacterium]|nr:PD-(D/E)XK nuclease family protein [Candidatus Levybacteria bacterium]
MAADKYSAVWVSHSSINDFLRCPRAYFLKNVYKNPDTGRKIQLVTPQMSLGAAVHDTLESLSVLPTERRFSESLMDRFELSWKKVSGKKGGFTTEEAEVEFKERGKAMIERVWRNPGPLKNLAVKIKMDIPHYWLSEEDGIILCGLIDWLEYDPDTDSVHIIDFKTSKTEENKESLQLPIYQLLVTNCQSRALTKASYWYLERNDEPTAVELSDLDQAHEDILKIARQIKVARQLSRFKCSHETGCYACAPYEAIVNGEAEHVGVDDHNKDLYLWNQEISDEDMSEIL